MIRPSSDRLQFISAPPRDLEQLFEFVTDNINNVCHDRIVLRAPSPYDVPERKNALPKEANRRHFDS